MLGSLFKRSRLRKAASLAQIPAGERVYAIGDIHGRLELFEQMISAIEEECRDGRYTRIVLLGDLIDRGPDSAGVVSLAREWGRRRPIDYLMGNHEEMFLASFTKPDVMRGFLKFGGRETLRSYGVAEAVLDGDDYEEMRLAMIEAVPGEDIAFLGSFKNYLRVGDYVFVHAGLRPNSPLETQLSHDCRWIREPFLSHAGAFPGMVVHGHTVTDEPVVRHNRIGIDTGAFQSGRLTALGLEGRRRWFLQASVDGTDQFDLEALAA